MGMFNKIKFWQKHDDFSLDENPFGNNDTPQNNSMDTFDNANNPLDNTAQDSSSSFSLNKNNEQNNINNPTSAIEMIKNGKITDVKEELHPEHISMQKDLEILSSKLDAIKMGIESMNQRLENLERMQKQKNEIQF